MASASRVKVSSTVSNRMRRPHASASPKKSIPHCRFDPVGGAGRPRPSRAKRLRVRRRTAKPSAR